MYVIETGWLARKSQRKLRGWGERRKYESHHPLHMLLSSPHMLHLCEASSSSSCACHNKIQTLAAWKRIFEPSKGVNPKDKQVAVLLSILPPLHPSSLSRSLLLNFNWEASKWAVQWLRASSNKVGASALQASEDSPGPLLNGADQLKNPGKLPAAPWLYLKLTQGYSVWYCCLYRCIAANCIARDLHPRHCERTTCRAGGTYSD